MEERAADGRLGVGPLVFVTVVAVLVRLLGYSGYFGSDEVTYTEAALRLLQGDWAVPTYVGANRLGVNLPVAGFAALFGVNEASLAAYSMLCSVLEVALVASLGSRLIGARAGFLGAIVLATLPMHAHLAGRLLADAPLSLAITASFLLFALGERTRRAGLFLAAGLAAGWSFWVKPHTIFYVLVLMAYPLAVRRIDWRWCWVVAGFAFAVLANCAMFQVLTGRFWFMLEVIRDRHGSGYLEADALTGAVRDGAAFYLIYLFGKVYHTWLLGPLALLGLWFSVPRKAIARQPGAAFVAFWALGLLTVLSLLPVKLQPLMLVPKQTNYMAIFAAPLALLAGLALVRWRAWAVRVILAVIVLPSLLLTLLLQSTVAVFTANAKGVVALARANPGITIYTTTNPFRAAQFDAMVHPQLPPLDVRLVGSWERDRPLPDHRRLAVIDQQSLSWGSGEPFKNLQDVPRCWVRAADVTPAFDGLGVRMLRAAVAAASASQVLAPVSERLQSMGSPAPAALFNLPMSAC